MNFSFKSHGEGCTPFSPCKSCGVVSLLRSSLNQEEFNRFSQMVDTENISFTEHLDGCSPLSPCKNCRMMQWLRTTLGEVKYSDMVYVITGQRPVGTPLVGPLQRRVDEFDFSVRTAQCLRNDNIEIIGDLVQRTEAEMLRTPNFGRKSLSEVKEVLADLGLRLGMSID